MTQEIKIFNSFLDKLPKKDIVFLFVFHLSKNNEAYLEAWVRYSKTIGVISIPYSEQKTVKEKIQNYTSVYSPNLDEIPGLIKILCNENKNKKIVLVEIGGYSAAILDSIPNVILVIEDTMRGHNNFMTNVSHIRCPVISIARSKIKGVENVKVGEVVAKSVLMLCKSLGIDNPNILLLSYGNIGKYVAIWLAQNKQDFFVFDSDVIKRKEAMNSGFTVLDRSKALSKADVIIGCTGNRSIDIEDMHILKDGCLLISGSSKQIEFPYKDLNKYIVSSKGSLPVEEINYMGKIIRIAYKGQPINFYYDFSLGNVFAVPMSALVQSVIWGLSYNIKIGLHDLPMDQQKQVADAFPKEIVSL